MDIQKIFTGIVQLLEGKMRTKLPQKLSAYLQPKSVYEKYVNNFIKIPKIKIKTVIPFNGTN